MGADRIDHRSLLPDASQRKQGYEEARSRSGHAGMSAGDEEEWQAGDFSSFSSTNPPHGHWHF
jgi:hypothetical protein